MSLSRVTWTECQNSTKVINSVHFLQQKLLAVGNVGVLAHFCKGLSCNSHALEAMPLSVSGTSLHDFAHRHRLPAAAAAGGMGADAAWQHCTGHMYWVCLSSCQQMADKGVGMPAVSHWWLPAMLNMQHWVRGFCHAHPWWHRVPLLLILHRR